MRKRQIGSSDLFVSNIGLGCMSLGTNEKEAISMLRSAIDAGINYLDTADLYDYGLNEEFVGKALRGRVREQVIVATKVGNRFTKEKNGWNWDPSKAYIMEEVKESLRRLGTDYIDLYQLHGGTIEDPIEETIEAFEQLQKDGVIRYYGISSIRPNVIREYLKYSHIVSVMMEYNLLNRRPEELFSLLNENHVSIIARGPVAKGLLTDHNDHKLKRAMDKGYLSYSYEELEHTIALVKQGNTRSLAETAIQYCLSTPVVASVIPGASSLEQLSENIRVAEAMPLTKEEYDHIASITKQDQYTLHR
ncbi:aldo/keto reductase [Ectobacillus sp. sgz5001026]|uniref:aldo/keto reductase n=1 Tax=Ectobacillus sp. sgz5001026 TaxID=3242473 RepID=UPI0036D27747